MENTAQIYRLGGNDYEVVKPVRLRDGMVLRSGDTYARIGPKATVLEEQIHTVSLLERGFPVPKVIESGEYGQDGWYFVEQSVGDEPFHKKFVRETNEAGSVSEQTFKSYMAIIDKYLDAQLEPKNRTNIGAEDFVESLLSEADVLSNYCYFGFDADQYIKAIRKAIVRMQDAPMGILQHDLNPYNILERGVIDFELVGFGPIGYDVLMSVRWGGTWFPNYPSRYPMGYSLSEAQIDESDHLVVSKATAMGLSDPRSLLEEFLLLKSAWAAMEDDIPQPDWPNDKIAFRRYRATLLNLAVNKYLDDEPIDYWNFSNVPGGEL